MCCCFVDDDKLAIVAANGATLTGGDQLAALAISGGEVWEVTVKLQLQSLSEAGDGPSVSWAVAQVAVLLTDEQSLTESTGASVNPAALSIPGSPDGFEVTFRRRFNSGRIRLLYVGGSTGSPFVMGYMRARRIKGGCCGGVK